MGNTTVVLLVLCLVFLIVFTSCTCYGYYIKSASLYPNHPKEGDHVILHCHSRYARSEDLDIEWSKDGYELTRNGTFVDEELRNRSRQSLITVDYDGQHIRIRNVLRSDRGNYTCSLYNRSVKYPLATASVIFDVRYYPTSEFPLCSVKPEKTDSQLTLSCLSEVGNPSVSVDWEVGREHDNQVLAVTNASINLKSEGGQFLTSEITITSTHIRSTDVYTCSLNSSDYSIFRKCFMHGYSILYAIHMLPSSLSVGVFDTAKFSCKTNLTHIVPKRWVWDSEPEVSRSRWFVSSATLLVNPVLAEDNGTLITCFALFDGHTVRADATLWVSQEDFSSTVVTTSSDSSNPNPQRGKGGSTSAWIAMFVVVLILLIISVVFSVFLYRRASNAKLSTPNESTKKIETGGQVVQQGNTITGGDEYMGLSPERNTSDSYTGLHLEGAASPRYVNKGYEQGTGRDGVGDGELYDYPETNESENKTNDFTVYSNVEM